jgi:sulfur-carrier protein adenylyltransferase/sulfurtransferase
MKTYGFESISTEELKKYINQTPEKDYSLIDVRQPAEYSQTHIPGALLISLPELESKLFLLPKDKDIIFYCHSGRRSRTASLMAADDKITEKHIYNLEGGISKWSGDTISQIPRIKVFDKAKTFYQFLIAAIGLEKGAEQFYDKLREMDVFSSATDVFGKLAEAEFSHAKLLYDILINYSDESLQPFDELYEDLSGDIVEGGDTLEELFQYIHSLHKYNCLHLLELALDVEFAAFDLYKTMAGLKTEEPDTANVLLTIAQAEKGHMKFVSDSFALCRDI